MGLRGLLPPLVKKLNQQSEEVINTVREKSNDLERFIYLQLLYDRNEVLFFSVVTKYIDYIMPIIYTPTVGLACQKYSEIFRTARGLYISLNDKGHILELMQNWPETDVKVIV